MRHCLSSSPLTGLLALSLALTAQTVAAQPSAPTPAQAHPNLWPSAHSTGLVEPATEQKITALMARMTLAEKVGQMIQADIGSITPEDLRHYPLGSILAGGSSPPLGAPDRSPAAPWIATARAFDTVAQEKRTGHTPIPLIIGIDAVHGNNNVVGATLFPHNSALGAMHDPALIRRIGRVTAEETAAIGFNWAFGPTLAVPQDIRWGRAYEGYGQTPGLVASYAGEMVRGLQGDGTIQHGNVAASVKHFLGDGGTRDGVDQGDTLASEADLIRIHLAGYPPAIEAGTMTVMASFNSWQGVKTHGNKSLLTDVLKGRLGFQGFVVGDWNGHGQVAGCTPEDCAQTFNAGLDMAMAPDSWKGLFDNTVAEVKAGKIAMARVDDAVRRILRVKFKLGLFDPARPYADHPETLGSSEHRAVARAAVRESLVLLKNEGVLPIKSSAYVLVAGDAADDIGRQAGGWTLSWQGDGNTRKDFPGATSIWDGIKAAVTAGGGTAQLSPDGSFTQKPDVAIVVFGEKPYAEMRGDIHTLEFQPGDKQALALLRKLKAQGIPTVSVFLSGRPLWVNPEINQSDAFVAAWFPGSEGEGVADVLIGGKTDFHGRLSFAWPNSATQFTLATGKDKPLFPLNYGLSYAQSGHVGLLEEVAGIDASQFNTDTYFARGKVPAPFRLTLDQGVTLRPVDSATTQEGAMALSWAAKATAAITGPSINLERETNGDLNLQITYRLTQATPLTLTMGDAAVPLQRVLKADGQWHDLRVPLKCFRDRGAAMGALTRPFALSGEAGAAITLSDLHLATDTTGTVCP
ncbi:MAG: glycoside hydrolase family 3 C-terminal domain-containing protein [Sphingomonadales bacterium]|nr:glycoside hydrolase family 3 C-terminal domain-containing protein [Sphingomonadales bacterium]MDE2170810.1 glycoside hydrolase family 3 C-terminal domain-containing protein [Sphingomonadales bacterium]